MKKKQISLKITYATSTSAAPDVLLVRKFISFNSTMMEYGKNMVMDNRPLIACCTLDHVSKIAAGHCIRLLDIGTAAPCRPHRRTAVLLGAQKATKRDF